ncbi:nuclear GTPase SLIP-GC [Liasis olivaceus]
MASLAAVSRSAWITSAGKNCFTFPIAPQWAKAGPFLLFVDSVKPPGRSPRRRKGGSPEMALPTASPGGEGQRLSHLRSIGSRAAAPGSDVIHFFKAVTLFGRNSRVVDCYLSSSAATTPDLKYISRIHARVIRTPGAYVLVDSSLTGVYVNDVRINGRVVLQEGDTVTFGHPAGKNLLLGSHTRQPNSPFHFLFEHCHCCTDQMQSVYGDRRSFPQELKHPALVSAGVSHPDNLNLAFTHNISHPQMALPVVLPNHSPLANSVAQCDHHTTLAPPLTSALPASSLITSPPPMLSQSTTSGAPETSSQARFFASSFSPLSASCGPASRVLRSTSPEYTVPGEDSFASVRSSPLRESSESTDSVSVGGSSESAVECVRPNSHQLFQHECASSEPERACVHPLLPGPTCLEASLTADHGGSQSEKPAKASGPWKETLQLTPVFQTETGGTCDRILSVFSTETPALNETDQDEETSEMNLCQSTEETAGHWASCASEPDPAVQEIEEIKLAGSSTQAASGSMDGCKTNFMEEPLPKASIEDADGVESRAVSLSVKTQTLLPTELGHTERDSADGTAEVFFTSGEEPMNAASTKILSQDKLDSERRSAILPSRNSSCGTQSGGVDCAVDSQQNVSASEDVEMESPVDAGLDCHTDGRDLDPEMGSATPVVAEGICDSVVEMCAEVGIWSDGVKPDEMKVAVTESLKDVNPNKMSSDDGIDSKAHVPKEMLLQKLSKTLVIDEQFKGKFFKEEKEGLIEASETIQENPHSKDLSEAYEDGRDLGTNLLQASPVLRKKVVPVDPSETFIPEPPKNLGELIFEKCLFQSSKILSENQVGEGAVMEEKSEHENPRGAESNKNSNNETADSRLQIVEELRQNSVSSLGISCVSVVGVSGGEPPRCKSGSERRCQSDSEYKVLPGEEESEVERRIISTAAATSKDAANQHQEAEDGLEEESRPLTVQERVNYSDADASLIRSLNAGPAERSSLGLADSKGDSSGDGLEEGRMSHLGGCSFVGTQLPSQKSQNEAGEGSVSNNNHFLSCHCVTEDEWFTSLNEEDAVKIKVEEEEEGARASLVANIPLAETKTDFDQSPMQMGSLNDYLKPCGTFSEGSCYAINQQKCLIRVDQQELESDRVEPESLENYSEVKSQGTDFRKNVLEDSLTQDSASEEACEPEAAVEQISLPVPEECGQDVIFPVESGWSRQTAENSHCKKERSNTWLSLPRLGILQPGNVAVNLPRETQVDSVELPGGDEFHFCISTSEAEKEEKGQCSPFKTDGLHRRETLLFSPLEHTVNVSESSEAFRKLTEESTIQRPSDLAIQEASVGPLKGTEMLNMSVEGQNSHHDQGNTVRAMLLAAMADVETPSLSAKSRQTASEALEGQGSEEMELDPVKVAGQPANSPYESAEGARVVKDFVQDNWPVRSRLPRQPGTAAVASPLGGAVKEHPGSEMSSSPCSGKDESTENTEVEVLADLHQDIQILPCQDKSCQLGNGPDPSVGYNGGLGHSEPRKILLQEEEELNSSSSRKRHLNKSEILDLEDYSCCQKKLCLVNFASVQGSACDRAASPVALPPPPDLKNIVDQFGKMIEKFLDQYRNHIPLCSDNTKRNGDNIAQIVRNYFKSNIYSSEPVTENKKTEMLALSSETAVAKDMDCQSEGGIVEAGESMGCDGPGSPKVQGRDIQIPDGEYVSPGGQSAWPGSLTQEQGKYSADSMQEPYFSEEETFPLGVGSALEDSSTSFPAESQNAVYTEENLATSSSLDITTSSEGCEPSPSPHRRNSDRFQKGASETAGTVSEASAEWDYFSDADWCSEGSGTPPDAATSCEENSQAPPRDTGPESVCPLALTQSEQGAPGLWLKGGELDGGDKVDEASSRKDPGAACATNEESPDGNQSRMQMEEGVFLQSSPVGSLRQDNMESAPAMGELFPHSPWKFNSKTLLQSSVGHSDPPLKTELPCEEHDGQDGGRNGSPSPPGTTSVASAVASAQGDDSPKGPSTSRHSPAPAKGSSLLPAKEGSARANEHLQNKGAGSSLSPLSSSSPAGRAVGAGKRGSVLEKGLCRPGSGAGHVGSHQASQEAPWIPGTSDCFPAPVVCSDLGPCSPLPLQNDGSNLAQGHSADTLLHFRVFREEKDLGELEDQLCPHISRPTSCSSVPSVSHHSLVPKASADKLPERPTYPAVLGRGDPRLPCPLVEPGPAEPSDSECLRVADAVLCPAAPKVEESNSTSRGHPALKESQSSCFREGAESRSPLEWASSEQDVVFQLQECQLVLAEILQSLNSGEGIDGACVEKWRDQIAVLQKATEMPQTYIAVVGNTGAGKSCLLNALLDEEAMLPTSAMRACTAVVVEISRAAEGSPYEADVEFLSPEEWDKELKALLEDMKDKAGILKKRCPDRKTEAGAAYSRVKAVYGRVEELEKLKGRQEVTQHLGTVKRICADTAADFRMSIEKFIDSRTDNLREMKGGEFWPIVKCVRIRVAKAEILRTGAVLVDLPGIRDSNAARDATAREYLKDCNAVWVTASITRAVDDKTAKELLSASFRRQLFMDGLYGSLAFICTKTDSFNITDIVRDLDLQDQICPLEDELRDLENQKMQAEIEKKHLYSQLQQELQITLPEQSPREGSKAADSAWLQRRDILEKEFRICALQREKEAKLRAISLICVQARNEFSKQRILMDFSAGLEEVSRRASYPESEEDGEEEMEGGDSAGAQPGELHVFTVSSAEYLKLGGKLLCNGQPQVFHDVKDTEIPALKKFAIDTALKHSTVATEKVIRDVACVLSQMVNYLTGQSAEDDAHQARVQEILQQALQGLPALLQEALRGSFQDMRHYFEALILASLQNGAEKAKRLSETIVKSWGLPVFGYPHSTYRAICNHHGVYTSPRYQCVDFNRQLAEPIHRVISVAWNEVFSSKLANSIECFTKALLDKLKSFFKDLERKLRHRSQVAEAVRAIYGQQMEAARARLFNFTLDQTGCITKKQRMISRLLTPEIQASMEPAYAVCSQLSGPGYFQRMKEVMEEFIHKQKDTIFDSVIEKLWQQLDLLQRSIQSSFQDLAEELTTSIRMQFEPMLQPVQKNQEILPELLHICAKMDKVCKRSGVDYVLPSSVQPEDRPPRAEAKLPRNGDCMRFSATSLDVQVGAISLPHIAVIEVSKEDITLTLAGSPTGVALPLRSVSHCECCLALGCLILYVSAEAAQELCFRCRVPVSGPGLRNPAALVIREAAREQRQLPQLVGCLSAGRGATSWVQTLSLQQGKEKLVSLGAHRPGQQTEDSAEQTPMAPREAPLLHWPLPGRKRAGEAVQLQLEKKAKAQPVGPVRCPLLQCRENAEIKPPPCPTALLGSCSPKGASPPDGPPCPMAMKLDGEPLAVPSSAGFLCVGANKETRGKPSNVNLEEEEGSLRAEKIQIHRPPL